MGRGVSEGFIGVMVCEEKLKELKEFVEHLGYYDTIAMTKYLQMRRNLIMVENTQHFLVGQTAKIFEVSTGVEYIGEIVEINGSKTKMDVGGTIYNVPTEMLYE